MKRRVLLTVAYDGTAYHGWQLQKNGNTIEAELNRHLTQLLGESVQVSGASRTDAGVHALGNLAVFDTESKIPPEKISYALNQRLPEDIRIRGSREVRPDFHPRRCETRKTYEYRITCGEFPVPTKRLYSHFTYRKMDLKAMQKAAEYLVGEHDFQSFCAAGNQTETTVRTIYSLSVKEQDGDILIRVCGNGFLYNMVRILAGTLMEVGIGHLKPEQMQEILHARDRQAAGPTAPARGLLLVGYEYPEKEAAPLQEEAQPED